MKENNLLENNNRNVGGGTVQTTSRLNWPQNFFFSKQNKNNKKLEKSSFQKRESELDIYFECLNHEITIEWGKLWSSSENDE